MEIVTKSEKETIELGRRIASKLKKGMVVVLTGDLGSGKTKLVEGILTYFNLENEISSPTFTIVNEYHTSDLNIYHFDVYRLEDSDEFLAIGGEEYFDKGACLIEWGEQIEDVLPKDFIRISFSRNNDEDNIRNIKIDNLEI